MQHRLDYVDDVPQFEVIVLHLTRELLDMFQPGAGGQEVKRSGGHLAAEVEAGGRQEVGAVVRHLGGGRELVEEAVGGGEEAGLDLVVPGGGGDGEGPGLQLGPALHDEVDRNVGVAGGEVVHLGGGLSTPTPR